MIEQSLIDRLCERLSLAPLAPAPASVGVIEPLVATDLPAIVVSIVENTRLGNGLGERSALVTHGALEWPAEIDLANPRLPDDSSFLLLSDDRKRLNLPHGGLVRRDGSKGELAAADISVEVDGVARTVVTGTPAASQFSVDPLSGLLTFGAALPATGVVSVRYVLGQWEQRTVRGRGVLKLETFAADGAAARNLSDKILSVLGQTNPLGLGFTQLSAMDIGSVEVRLGPPPTRVRTMRFRFEFEQAINVPESSGGIIQRIPVQVVLAQKESVS